MRPLARIALILALIVSAPAHSHAAEIMGISHALHEGKSRVTVLLDSKGPFVQNKLDNPTRVYFDFIGSKLSTKINKTEPVQNGVVREVRAAQFSENIARIVVELDRFEGYQVSQLQDPARVVIDITPKAAQAIEPAPSPTKRRIVLDAGHGGHDPGAIGPGKLYEKNIALDLVKRIKKQLDAQGQYEVFLTRDKDVFLTLEQRTVIANNKNADLFISVHLNANNKKTARGLETYLLNWTDDEAAQRVAARENRISLRRMKQERSELGLILASLELQQKRDESLHLAHTVQSSMYGSVSSKYDRVTNHGVKQALFYVLFGANMPSVLVEASFVSNPDEAKRLRTEDYREHLAQGIAQGIEDYFKSTPDTIQKIALNK